MFPQKENVFKGLAYYRLSNEDLLSAEKLKRESNSITNQRELVHEFLKKHPEIILLEEKIDDGYSGVHFDRPGFQEMIELVRQGVVNCIIVKDLSRFGRNYIEVGRYLEKIFPFSGVRFIAINDNYDSLNSNSSDDIMIPFRNLMNDAYSKDISTKVRSQLDIKRKQGEFIGSFAPFGYKKDDNNHNKLIIDEEAAEVVRNIFQWRIAGSSNEQIAEKLNGMGILSPMEYKNSLGDNFKTSFKKNNTAKWGAVSVKRILENELYLGHMLQGKAYSPNLKIKKRRALSKEQWYRKENMHEPIIDHMDFTIAQKAMLCDTRVSPISKELALFSGIVYCGGCKQPMVKKQISANGKKYAYLTCSTYKKDKNKCTSHLIREQKVYDSVLIVLQNHIIQILDAEEILEKAKQQGLHKQQSTKWENIKRKQEEELKKYKHLKMLLYEDLTSGLLDREDYEDYKKIYSQRIHELEETIGNIDNRPDPFAGSDGSKEVWISRYRKNRNITELSRHIIMLLIKQIHIYGHDEISVRFEFDYDYDAVISNCINQ